MNPENFVPSIIRARDRARPWFDWLPGSVLFSDVSGFTALGESLAALGSEGSEILTDILNRYFSAMIGIIHENGGEVMKFGGDALICLFPWIDQRQAAMRAAEVMQENMRRFQSIRTRAGKFSLSMKIGVAEGDVLLGTFGEEKTRCDYIFAGTAVELAAQAQKKARPGKIVNLGTSGISQSIEFPQSHSKSGGALPTELQSYLIPEVYQMVSSGYERYVGTLQSAVPVFAQFTGISFQRKEFDPVLLQDFFCSAMELTQSYGGRLNSLMLDDKGSNLYLHFGAPNQSERKEREASHWALEWREQVARQFPQIHLKIGMTVGRVFGGIVGGSGQFYYTVNGDVVNLAARLMQAAGENEICVTSEFADAAGGGFLFQKRGVHRMKGKTQDTQLLALMDRSGMSLAVRGREEVIGRKVEQDLLSNHLQLAAAGNPRFIIVEGVAGTGKSFLANHIASTATRDGWSVLTGESEITLSSHPYTPWLSIFRQLLFHGNKPDLDTLLSVLQQTDESFVPFADLHAEFFQLEGSRTQYDDKTRTTLLHHQLCRILLKRVENNPTLLFLDDLHWFDSLSLQLLSDLLGHLKQEPLMVLCASRPEWQKSRFENRPQTIFLRLSEIDRETTSEVAVNFLGGAVKKDLLDFLFQNAAGNHLFTWQLLDYLWNKRLVYRWLGEWTLKRDANLSGSLTHEEVVSAQIDRLSMPEKIHLRMAACMGPTFSRRVLEKTLGKLFRRSAFESLCALGYFQEIDSEWMTFPHAVIQDILYHSIPFRIRKRTHRKLGSSLESIFADSIRNYFPNLANHFWLAGIRPKAVHYSMLAGEQLYRSLSFPESRAFFQRAYDLLKHSSDTRRWDAALHLCECLIRTGKLPECLDLTKKLRRKFRKLTPHEIYHRASILHFDAMRRQSDYKYVKDALALIEKEDSLSSQSLISLTHLVGSAYFWLGNFDRAAQYLRRVIDASSEVSGKEEIISAYYFLFTIAADRQEMEEAREMMEAALRLATSTGNLYQELRIKLEWAGVLSENGKPENAKEILMELLPQTEKCGDYYLVASVLGALGQAENYLEHWDQARQYLEEAARTFLSNGISNGWAKSMMFLGILSFHQGDFESAYRNYLEATKWYEGVGEMTDVTLGYYNLAEVSYELQKPEEAFDWLEKGLQSFQPENNPQLAKMFEELKRKVDA